MTKTATSKVTMVPPPENVLRFYREAQGTFECLYERWQEERGFEDVQVYAVRLEERAKMCGLKVIRMMSSPFGAKMRDLAAGSEWKFTRTQREYRVERTK